MSLIISVGRNGGLYLHRGFGFRLCLWWLSITLLPTDVDDVLSAGIDALEAR